MPVSTSWVLWNRMAEFSGRHFQNKRLHFAALAQAKPSVARGCVCTDLISMHVSVGQWEFSVLGVYELSACVETRSEIIPVTWTLSSHVRTGWERGRRWLRSEAATSSLGFGWCSNSFSSEGILRLFCPVCIFILSWAQHNFFQMWKAARSVSQSQA